MHLFIIDIGIIFHIVCETLFFNDYFKFTFCFMEKRDIFFLYQEKLQEEKIRQSVKSFQRRKNETRQTKCFPLCLSFFFLKISFHVDILYLNYLLNFFILYFIFYWLS